MKSVETLRESSKNIVRNTGNSHSNYSLSQIEKYNITSLKGMVEYLSRMKEEGVLSESQFSKLITDVCSNFIENEVEQRISQYLNKSMFMLFH